MFSHEPYMLRCIELAKHGAGFVAPNPMVGAVLVYNDRIIGEGWHEYYGQAHAEVNCINDAINLGNGALISQADLYVSLEPCSHFGKTPPCADLIIQHKIPRVITGCLDPAKEVNGQGIEKLRKAGVETVEGILEAECKDLNKRFFTFQQQKRPYVILKWAETADHKIGTGTEERLKISNDYTNRLVHKWRSEEAAILVGTDTALLDDPSLTTRFWPGSSPIRLVVDLDLKLPSHLKIFNEEAPTIIFNAIKQDTDHYRVDRNESLVRQITDALYQLKIQSVLVEGGARLLQSFIDEGIWDEARRIGNRQLTIGKGVNAPVLKNYCEKQTHHYFSDTIEVFNP